MPKGTLFSKYRPIVFEELQIKGDTWDGDFVCLDLHSFSDHDDAFDLLSKNSISGESFDPKFGVCGRDGLFEHDQLFAVWEKEETEKLIELLKTTLK